MVVGLIFALSFQLLPFVILTTVPLYFVSRSWKSTFVKPIIIALASVLLCAFISAMLREDGTVGLRLSRTLLAFPVGPAFLSGIYVATFWIVANLVIKLRKNS